MKEKEFEKMIATEHLRLYNEWRLKETLAEEYLNHEFNRTWWQKTRNIYWLIKRRILQFLKTKKKIDI